MNTLISISFSDLSVIHEAVVVAVSEYERREKNLLEAARCISDSNSEIRKSFVTSAFQYHLSVEKLRNILKDTAL